MWTAVTHQEAGMATQLVGSPTKPRGRSERRHDIDALRVLAVLVLLYYHSSRPFDFEPWHVKNDELSLGLQLFGTLVTPWRLPLLFLMSGAGTFWALGFRSARRYIGDRLTRLFVPLAVGMLVVVPPQVYVERIGTWMARRQSPIDFEGSFFEFYPRVFAGVYPNGNLSWHHLWFLAYLFAFSLVALPLFLHLRGPSGRELTARLAAFFGQGRRIFLLALPLIAIHVALRGRYPSTHTLIGDWWNVAHYLVLFVFGYVLVADSRFGQAFERNRRTALVLVAIAAPIRAVLVTFGDAPAPYSAGYVLLMTLRGCSEWFALVAALGYAQRYLNRPSPLLRYAGEIVYPFYICHQTVIVVLGFFVIQWDAGVAVKFVVLSTASLIGTVLLCELIRKTNLSRFLFGLKPAPRTRDVDGG
jgi:glucans biosynthesis protein C